MFPEKLAQQKSMQQQLLQQDHYWIKHFSE